MFSVYIIIVVVVLYYLFILSIFFYIYLSIHLLVRNFMRLNLFIFSKNCIIDIQISLYLGLGYFILFRLWVFRFYVVGLGYFILIGLGLFYFNWVVGI